MTEVDPEFAWGQETYMLANIANSLQTLVWLNSKDGEKGRNRPKPIEPPKSKKKKEPRNAYTVDEYKKLLSQPRKEV